MATNDYVHSFVKRISVGNLVVFDESIGHALTGDTAPKSALGALFGQGSLLLGDGTGVNDTLIVRYSSGDLFVSGRAIGHQLGGDTQYRSALGSVAGAGALVLGNGAGATETLVRSSASEWTLNGPVLTVPALSVAGLTGAVNPSRYVGRTTTGAGPTTWPTGGYFVGDVVLSVVGSTATFVVCTTAGTPGTWTVLSYQPLDSDLTTIAGLTATTDNFLVSVASAWASRTPAQVKTTLNYVAADIPTLAPLASPTFTGTVTLPTVTLTGAVTSTGSNITVGDGTSTDALAEMLVHANIASFRLKYTTTDTQAAALLTLSGTNGQLKLGPGQTTAPGFTITATGQTTATMVGTLTLAAPVITGHATIEGVVPTGATGTGKLVFDGTPTLVTPVIGAATGTSLALSGLVTGTNTWDAVATVTGSDATTTGQTLVDITGLTAAFVSGTYQFDATLRCTNSADANGIQFGCNITANLAASGLNATCIGTTTAVSGTNATINANNTATVAFLTATSVHGTIRIWGTVIMSGAGTFSIRFLKVTSGTATAKVGSILYTKKVA